MFKNDPIHCVKRFPVRKTGKKSRYAGWLSAGCLGMLLAISIHLRAKPFPDRTWKSRFSVSGMEDSYIKGTYDRVHFHFTEGVLPGDGQPSSGLETLQCELRKTGQQLISYTETDTVLHALLVGGAQVRHISIHADDYRDSIRIFKQLCSDKEALNRDYKRFCRLSYYLYRLLFEPLQAAPGRIVIAGGENMVPFDALMTDESGTDYLLYHFAISYTDSVTAYLQSLDRSVQYQPSFLGLAPEAYAAPQNQLTLHGAARSLRKIARCLGDDHLYYNKRAATGAFPEAAQKSSMLHVYTHTGQERNQPVLYLYDRSLCGDELVKREKAWELVFLAGCETGGYRRDNLKSRFLNTGAASVISTAWQAETVPVYAISEVFYELISMGMPKDLALQEARIRFLRSAPRRYLLPYYWAGIVLTGDSRPLFEKESPVPGFYFAAVSNFLFFGLSLTKDRRRSDNTSM